LNCVIIHNTDYFKNVSTIQWKTKLTEIYCYFLSESLYFLVSGIKRGIDS
jgi:hypothetical protein